MIRMREDLEKTEKQVLAPYAIASADSKGRRYKEKEANDRTCFQRDRHRIIYSKAFMRLKGKTQVVLAEHGDHFRNRITHTNYVATVARDIARSLDLNEDITEAIALAHDLGHPCFGHEGEEALNKMLEPYGEHFEHNEQSLRVVEVLEKKSSRYPGLNLSYEVLDGLDKHRTAYDHPRSRNTSSPSLEAQIVNLADEIAYKYHDLDDALRAGVISYDDLDELAIWRESKESLEKNDSHLTWNLRSKLMELMITDVTRNTDLALTKNKIKLAKDVTNFPSDLASFSDSMQEKVNELGDFLFKRFYKSEPVSQYNQEGRKIITFLFQTLYDGEGLMPEEYEHRLSEEKKHIVVKDYIAGMTDHYAIDLYNKYKN